MRTYWDLSESERAALSADDVQRYVDAELMLKGVLKVKPLELEPELAAPKPSSTSFIVQMKNDHYSRVAAFATIESAKAFLALNPSRIDNEYIEGEALSFVDAAEWEIVERPVFTRAEKDSLAAELKRSLAVKAANARRTREHAEAVKKQNEALRGLWEDWTRCREHEAQLRKVFDTFREYFDIAGDAATAAKFLQKVYDADDVREADERFGFLPSEVAA